jgi:hypothetical protein
VTRNGHNTKAEGWAGRDASPRLRITAQRAVGLQAAPVFTFNFAFCALHFDLFLAFWLVRVYRKRAEPTAKHRVTHSPISVIGGNEPQGEERQIGQRRPIPKPGRTHSPHRLSAVSGERMNHINESNQCVRSPGSEVAGPRSQISNRKSQTENQGSKLETRNSKIEIGNSKFQALEPRIENPTSLMPH